MYDFVDNPTVPLFGGEKMPGIQYIARVVRGMRFKKLNQMMDVVKEKSGHCKVRTFCDIVWCALRYGAGYYD